MTHTLEARETALSTGDDMPEHVHLWLNNFAAICGATNDPHPECRSPLPNGGYPVAVDGHCPSCFRPICPKCRALA